MDALAKLAVAVLAAALGGCSQLSAFTSPDEAPGSLAREALARPAPMWVHPQPRRPRAPAPPAEPFVVDVAHADLWARIRSGYVLGAGPDEGVAGELAFYAGNRDFVLRALERGRPYLHHIVERLDRYDMPMELALLPVVESAFQPNAYSRSRAAGLWQFIPATGKRFGLEQNHRYDGRRDVIAATDAALEYLQQLHGRFSGDWLLALAAYNCGERNVERAIDANHAAGKPTDFWSLALPAETRAYVPRLLAVARMVAKPEAFDLTLPALRNEPWFAAVEIARDVRLADVARHLGIERAEVERLNPGYRQGVTGGGSHTVVVPVGHVATLLNGMDALVTAPAPEPARAVASGEDRGEGRRYRIRQGDTLGVIAERFAISVAELKRMNGLSGNAIRAGHQLRVPGGEARARTASTGFAGGRRMELAGARLHTVSRGDTLWHVSRRYQVSVDDIAAMNGLPRSAVLSPGQKLVVRGAEGQPPAAPAARVAAKAPAAGPAQYRVRKGDSLWTIARRFGVTVDALRRWNDISRKAQLEVGQTLTVGAGDAGT